MASYKEYFSAPGFDVTTCGRYTYYYPSGRPCCPIAKAASAWGYNDYLNAVCDCLLPDNHVRFAVLWDSLTSGKDSSQYPAILSALAEELDRENALAATEAAK